MPSIDDVGKGASVAPSQIGSTGANVGVTIGLTVMVRVAVVAQWPSSGVNV